MSLLDGVHRVLLAHAHPDDETLASGSLIAHLVGRGVECQVLTATRGEQGEIRPGTFTGDRADFPAHREQELAGALAALGVRTHVWLGRPPARAEGLPPRWYADSGMAWVREGLAGPSPDAPADAFSVIDLAEPLADLEAAVRALRPDVLISYDDAGGYGHPDHVRMRELAEVAGERCGVPLLELVDADAEGAEVLELDAELLTVVAALAHHASQVQVEGAEVVHVGGQREPVLLRPGLRRVLGRP